MNNISIGARANTYWDSKILTIIQTPNNVIDCPHTISEIMAILEIRPQIADQVKEVIGECLHVTQVEKWSRIAQLLQVELKLDRLNGFQEGYHVGDFHPDGTYTITNPPHLNP